MIDIRGGRRDRSSRVTAVARAALARTATLGWAAAFCCAALAACGGAPAPTASALAGSARPATQPATRPASPTASPTPSGTPSPSALPVDPGAGLLPQTPARPDTTSPQFQAMTFDLWLAVQTGDADYGLPAFFPVDAYKQVKRIWNPQYDWTSRLWLDFRLDVQAAHKLLGADPANATFAQMIVPDGYVHWIPPGACYNSTGYWQVGGPRVIYQQDGQTRSFGVASLISWRGTWYVVHFGGVTRGAYGMVDNPSAGTGYPGPGGGC